jgi:hypothetical protein
MILVSAASGLGAVLDNLALSDVGLCRTEQGKV